MQNGKNSAASIPIRVHAAADELTDQGGARNERGRERQNPGKRMLHHVKIRIRNARGLDPCGGHILQNTRLEGMKGVEEKARKLMKDAKISEQDLINADK